MIAGLIGAASVLLPVQCGNPYWPPPGWALIACDVGQGDGVVLAAGAFSHLLARTQGVKIPLEWATDKGGRPTDDPKVALDGFIQAMGGYKGIAIAYAIDALCGVLTGAGYSYGVKSMYEEEEEPSQTGHMMIAINLAAIISEDRPRPSRRRSGPLTSVRTTCSRSCDTVQLLTDW